MKRFAIMLAAAAALGAATSGAMAAPAFPGAGAGDNPLVEKARTFCYDRHTGRFLHWGSCRRARPVYSSRPRVYCRNRYTGQFLHWGSCRR
ncbi:hypothetical protein [Enterovirga rhinocerotis]|uniref:Uncharacterized protein n=1 Tax=Enterovirga rhinocerotis TaxID=1339210 RepID=A0A4R7C8F6_9HYPH|nr:hypothetical protein [Enterovirga rhinocerotis]TDR94651.1 hypothetical protein EV668_1939 [Enterovirga rhinocerotis]